MKDMEICDLVQLESRALSSHFRRYDFFKVYFHFKMVVPISEKLNRMCGASGWPICVGRRRLKF
jgi:hypothetical protein